MTAQPLFAFLDQLRGRGVRSFKGSFAGEAIEVELAPAIEPEAPGSPATAKRDPDLCRCGCPAYEHTNGLCLRGCEAIQCAGPEPTG